MQNFILLLKRYSVVPHTLIQGKQRHRRLCRLYAHDHTVFLLKQTAGNVVPLLVVKFCWPEAHKAVTFSQIVLSQYAVFPGCLVALYTEQTEGKQAVRLSHSCSNCTADECHPV